MSRRGLWSVLVGVCLAGVMACGTIARQLGESTTEGALEEVRERQERVAEGEAEISIPRTTAEQATQGILDALSSPEQVTQLRRLVDALVSQSLRSAAGGGVPAAEGSGTAASGPGMGGAGQGPVSELTSDVTRALGLELERLLGPDGKGPLAQSLAATAGQIAASMVEQSRDEFGTLFPDCGELRGAEARSCVEERLAQFGAAFSRGATEGAREALRPWLLLLAFGGGLLVGLLLFLGWSAARVNRETGGRAGLFRQRRPT